MDLSNFIGKYYEMNPETETELHGDLLKDGMVILTARVGLRMDLTKIKGEPNVDNVDYNRARMRNRWATISDVINNTNGVITFIARYEDDNKIIRPTDKHHVWLVKLDSIPDGQRMVWDEVINHYGLLEFSGTPSDVKAFLKRVRTPLRFFRVHIGVTDRTVPAETYLKSYSIQESGLRMDMVDMANLITDMVHGGCEFEELAQAIRHSVLIVDSETINDESTADIERMKIKYQSGKSSAVNLSNLVGQYYEMDPKTDVVVPNGRNLKDGMVVLIEIASLRQDLSYLENPLDPSRERYLYSAREKNQWCTVAELEVLEDISMVSFTGLYEDGLRRRRIIPLYYAWIVKFDSLGKM